MTNIEFYFGLGSRYSYLASTQIARIEATHGCSFLFRPISSVELMQMRGRSPFESEPVSGQYDSNYRRRDAETWAAYYRVPFVEPRSLPTDHRLMARACHAAGLQGAMRPYCAALFAAVFSHNAEIDEQVCLAVASDIGLDTGCMTGTINSDTTNHAVTAAAQRAHERGAFGVPTFFVGETMFWGNDRLILLEHHLATLASR